MYRTIFPQTSAISEHGQIDSNQQKPEKGEYRLAASIITPN